MNATTLNTGTPLALDPAAIIIPEAGLRRTPAGEEAEAGFARCVAQLGVLQPIVVRAAEEPGRYRLVAGRRRLRAAIAAGLPTIPAIYRPDLSDADATTIEMAENVQRAAMAPLDQWRAIVRLRELGWTDSAAIADSLGLPHRLVQRMEKLGSLHPRIVAAIEQHGMPPAQHLHDIASAPPEQQERAIASRKAFAGDWWSIAEACRVASIPRDRAIFDVATAGVVFTEDLFAEPDSPGQFTTTDVAGFMAAQRAALEAQAAASKGKLVVASLDKHGGIALPKQWRAMLYTWRIGDKLPRGCTAYVTVDRNGKVRGIAAAPPEKKKPAPPKSPTRDAAPQAGSDADPDQDGDAPEESPTPPPAPKRLTQAGRELLAELRTDALRAALRDRPATPEHALAVLLLALSADNVTVYGERGRKHYRTDFEDIAAAVFVALEQAPNDQGRMLDRLAAEAAARILICTGVKAGNASGRAAEWVGDLVGAGAAMPRLDREELLGCFSAEMLREAALAAGVKPGKAAEMRRQLAGAAPALALPEARFHAEPPELDPAPTCERMAGLAACRCGWKESDGAEAEDCARGLWQARMDRLGLARGAPRPAPPPEDHAAQRAEDAKAFDGPAAGQFDCGWSGDSVCREDGTTRCLRQCPRHERYAAWITTPAGKRARRAAENAAAKASLRAPRSGRKGAEA